MSVQVIFPICALIALGYLIKRLKLCDDHTVTQMNNVTFRVFLPVLLFSNVYHTDIKTAFDPKLLGFAVIASLSIYLLSFPVILLLEKDNKKRGVLIQGIFRSNFIIFGLPISISLYGESAGGAAAIIIAVIIPMYNALSVLALEIFRGSGKGFPIKKVLKGIVTNPLIIASVFALLLLFSGMKLPNMVDKVVTQVSSIATPVALTILGMSFVFSNVKKNIRPLSIGLGLKLLVVPLIYLTISVFLGFRNVELAILLALFAAPTAVSSFTMAEQMGADSELAGQIVVVGSIFSMFTMFLWIFVLKQLLFI